MPAYPASMAAFFQQYPDEFKHSRAINGLMIILFIITIIVSFIYPTLALILAGILFINLLFRPRYIYNNQTKHRIIPVYSALFTNGSLNSLQIIDAFVNKQWLVLFQLLQQPEQAAFKQQLIDAETNGIFSDESDSLLHEIYLEIWEEIGSNRYYCRIWAQPLFGHSNPTGLTEVHILTGYDYQLLHYLIHADSTI